MELSYSEIKYIKRIANNFKIANGEITHITKVDSGRINTTYKVTVTCTNDTVSYMLQKINRYVFTNVNDVMHNALLITNHLKKKKRETLEYIFTKEDKPLFYYNDEVYRMTKFIHAEIFQNITRPHDMYNFGYAVGDFFDGLIDFNANLLSDTIPNFHNTPIRYKNLLISGAINNTFKNENSRYKEAKEDIDFINENRNSFGTIVDALKRDYIPIRVTHNDTKLNNVLFDRKTNVPRCLIDLDTVMRGSVLYDIADAIRSGANTSSEDEKKTYNIKIDFELMREFLRGFKKGSKNTLTSNEISLLPDAIMIISFELGMRFLTDYFDGDKYFGIINPDDNLTRARVQFALAKDIKNNMTEITNIVNDVMK